MLQKQYVASDTSETSEINVKRILTAVVPKLINENQELQNSNPDKSIVTESDETIVKYLAGAVLRWALKKFHNEEKSWCQNQIVVAKEDFYQNKVDRGLITCTDTFTNMIMECENQFRKKKTKKKVLVNVIAESVDYTQFYPEDTCPGDVINKLLKRYVRMRAYIATKHIQDIYQEKKRKRKSTNETSRAPLYVSSSKTQVISIYFRFSCRRGGCNRFFFFFK